jgi:hypothetical protein
MFRTNKRNFLLLLMVLMVSSSSGCATMISRAGVYSAGELYSPQTRAEVTKKFGEADETTTCPGGRIVENRWVRQRTPAVAPNWLYNPSDPGDLIYTGWALEPILFPWAAYRSEKAILHYAFVYDESGRVLYRYDLKTSPPQRFNAAMNPLAKDLYTQLDEGKCDTWSTCIADYVKEARQRAECMGYTLGPEEEQTFDDLLCIGEWVDSGHVLPKEGLLDIDETLRYRF